MNHYRKKPYYRKRNYNSRSNRRYKDTYHQPLENTTDHTPYSRHTLTKGDVEAVVEALLSGTLTQGKELERFESLLAKLTHCHYALAVNSGTAAIHTVLAAVGIETGDEVITSTLNFSAIANMVTLMGGIPVLVDCDPETLTMSVEAAAEAVTPKTKAIFANNFAGQPSDMFALRKICDEHSIALLEDACHGLGGRYRGHYTGNQADMTCFSFHPSKAITSGEGGAITTNDIDKFAYIKMFRHHGIQKDSDYFVTEDVHPGHHQEVQFPGMNYRMSELQAALGRNQLTRLDRHLERRRAIAQVYNTSLSEMEGVIIPQSSDWADHAFHLYPIQFTGPLYGKRDVVFDAFKENAIDVQVHYVPIHLMPIYKEMNAEKSFPNAESYYKSCLSLPLYPDLSINEIDRIVDILKKALDTTQPVEDVDSQVSDESVKAVNEDQAIEPDTSVSGENSEPVEEKKTDRTKAPRRKTTPYRRRNRKPDAKKQQGEAKTEAPVEKTAQPEKVAKTVKPVKVQEAVKPEKVAEAPEKKSKGKPPSRKPAGRRKLGQPAEAVQASEKKPVETQSEKTTEKPAVEAKKPNPRKRTVRRKKPTETDGAEKKTTARKTTRAKTTRKKAAPAKKEATEKTETTKPARKPRAKKAVTEDAPAKQAKKAAAPKAKRVARPRKKKVEPKTEESS